MRLAIWLFVLKSVLLMVLMIACPKIQKRWIEEEKTVLAKVGEEVETARTRRKVLEEKAVALAAESEALRKRLKELSETAVPTVAESTASPAPTPFATERNRQAIKAFVVGKGADEFISKMTEWVELSEEEAGEIRRIAGKAMSGGMNGWREAKAEIRAVLGEGRYQVYLERTQRKMLQQQVSRMVARFDALKMPLQDGQKQALLSAMEGEQLVESDGFDEETFRAMHERDVRILQRLKPVLTPAQLNLLAKEQERELNLMESAARLIDEPVFGH